MTERVLAIVAHPDDETFGCGGALAKHALMGHAVGVIALADGCASRGNSPTVFKARHAQFRSACKILGTEDVFAHQFADNMMDNVALLEIVRFIERHIERFKPTVVYTHWRGDLNVDHQITHRAANVACRPQPGCTVKQTFYFEVPCSTAWGEGFAPQHFIDIDGTLDRKMEAAQCYETELRPDPHPRSRDGLLRLARYRGSQVGIQNAEAFMVGRIVV